MQSPSSTAIPEALCQASQAYETLIDRIRPTLREADRTAVDLTLSCIRSLLPEGTIRLEVIHSVPISGDLQDRQGERVTNRQRYLGEASDVRFFNTIKQRLQVEDPLGSTQDDEIETYDQEELPLHGANDWTKTLELPSRELADSYVDIYFTTIHVAYPFICKPSFMVRYEKLWKGDLGTVKDASWSSLLRKLHFASATISTWHEHIERYSSHWPAVTSLSCNDTLRITDSVTLHRYHFCNWGVLHFVVSFRNRR